MTIQTQPNVMFGQLQIMVQNQEMKKAAEEYKPFIDKLSYQFDLGDVYLTENDGKIYSNWKNSTKGMEEILPAEKEKTPKDIVLALFEQSVGKVKTRMLAAEHKGNSYQYALNDITSDIQQAIENAQKKLQDRLKDNENLLKY